MIFRALFWIGLVSLLMPREPNIGLGRPGAGTSPASAATSSAVAGLLRPGKACEGYAAACAGRPTFLASFQDQVLGGLAKVKAEIDADRRARAGTRARAG
jgi:hypothetical protein